MAAQESWAACAASQALGICPLARWSSPSPPLHTLSEHVVQPWHYWEVLFAAALGCPAAFPVFHFLKGNRLAILYQNQHFGLFIPLGEKILYLLQLEQSAALRLGRGQSQRSWRLWRSLEFAGLCRHTARQFGPTECDSFPQERIKVPTQA